MKIITLDGPTASGKSSIARAVADQLGGMHFNSGLLYRAIGHVAAQKGFTRDSIYTISIEDVSAIVSCLTYHYHTTASVYYAGADITAELKTASHDTLASCVSELPHVRAVVTDFARTIHHPVALVADGRDCGTVLFPHAEYKFFITAPLEVRAQRWQKDQRMNGKEYSLATASQLVDERDTRDMNRAIAPLKKADDARVIDTAELTLAHVIRTLVEQCSK